MRPRQTLFFRSIPRSTPGSTPTNFGEDPQYFTHRDEVEVIELIADDYFRSSRQELRSLRALARDIPTLCHGVTLGPASVSPVDVRRVQRLARIIEAVEPVMWSEHLAFVRAGGYEIGHLAAPPRNAQTAEGAIRNIEQLRTIVGMPPALENIATLIDPPYSSMTEAHWNRAIAEGTGCPLLLDLHNLYANCANFGLNPHQTLRQFMLERVRIVHLSGGSLLDPPSLGIPGAQRVLDDHCHDVPNVVFDMLTELAERCANPLLVIIERDGRYPDFSILTGQLRQARVALSKGRRLRQQLSGRARELATL